jgi:hypothetical protein
MPKSHLLANSETGLPRANPMGFSASAECRQTAIH